MSEHIPTMEEITENSNWRIMLLLSTLFTLSCVAAGVSAIYGKDIMQIILGGK